MGRRGYRGGGGEVKRQAGAVGVEVKVLQWGLVGIPLRGGRYLVVRYENDGRVADGFGVVAFVEGVGGVHCVGGVYSGTGCVALEEGF